MKFHGVALLAFVGYVESATLWRGAQNDATNPVQQVVDLLTQLEGKIGADAAREEEVFAKKSAWCSGSSQDKEFEIRTATSNIESLTAKIGKAKADGEASKTQVEELANSIAEASNQLEEAKAERGREQSDFGKTEAELSETVDMIRRALEVLQRNMKGGAALLQATVDPKNLPGVVQARSAVVDAAALSLNDKQRLVALAQSSADAASDDFSDDSDLGAPKAAAYESHSKSIVDVLEDLLETAETKLAASRKAETTAKHAFNMLSQSLTDQLDNDSKEKSAATSDGAEAAQNQAKAEGDLAVEKSGLADAQSALKELTTTCTTLNADHEASVANRNDELKALSEAKAAIADSTGGAEGQVYGFLQVDHASLRTSADLHNFEVVNLVRRLAKKDQSPALAQLANRIAAVLKQGGPFGKVKNLIRGLIDRLENEGLQEANHKAFCDKQQAAAKSKQEELEAIVAKLGANIDAKVSASNKLKNDVKDLQTALRNLAKEQSEMDAVRTEEKAAFDQKKADLEQGLTGVQRAVDVLKKYYGAALVQESVPENPEFHSQSSGAGSSILGMLDVIQSDFSKSLAQATDEEDTASADHEAMTKKNTINKAVMEKDVAYKQKEIVSLDKEVSELTSDRGSTQSELDAVNQSLESYAAQCTAKAMPYEERKARRESEIAGLREALQILSSGAGFLQRK